MRQYYAVISVAAAILLLLLPIVILLGSSGSSDPSEPEDQTSGISQDEYERLKQQLAVANSKLSELEKDATKQAPEPAEAIDTRKPVASEVMTPARRTSASSLQPQQSSPAVEDLQRIEDRIEALNKQLAQLAAAKNSQADPPTPSAEETAVEGDKPDASDVAASLPADSEATLPDRDDASLMNPEKTAAESTAMADPKTDKVLTASELNKMAKSNLRDRMVTEVDPEEIDEEPVEQVVEISLRRPLDGMTVNRVEQLYAQTTAPGWPVVLVRSSFDDEEWWAQPISGRRGAQITARVHFGNDATPRGTAFSMVILLLDGYEEAVRFRTARRFDKIPKGIRRSRQFMFVLK